MKRRFLPRILNNNNNKKKLSFQDTILTYNLQKIKFEIVSLKDNFCIYFFLKKLKLPRDHFYFKFNLSFPIDKNYNKFGNFFFV